MIELKIDNDRIKKCEIDGYGFELMSELLIGVSALLYGMGDEQEKGYEFWRKIFVKGILPYKKVKELFTNEG